MCVDRIINPISQGLIGSVFQRLTSTSCRNHFRAEHFHTLHVRLLALHVDLAHVHFAFHTHECTYCSRCYTMLTCTCLCNNAFLTKSAGEENLSERVIYFMRTGVTQIFSLQIDLRSI